MIKIGLINSYNFNPTMQYVVRVHEYQTSALSILLAWKAWFSWTLHSVRTVSLHAGVNGLLSVAGGQLSARLPHETLESLFCGYPHGLCGEGMCTDTSVVVKHFC